MSHRGQPGPSVVPGAEFIETVTVPMRKILHVDMDAFYASVEQRDAPDLKGTPVIVGGDPASRAVVCAASYEARAFGIHSAMPCSQARRLCPQATFVRPDFEKYHSVSRQVRAIFERHSVLVEPLSLDEAYLDVTEELTGIPTATETARAIRREIREETALTASAGVAPNKFLAKIASDWNKPDGLFVIRPDQVEAFLPPLPVRKLPGVGKATEAALEAMGTRIVADLQRFSREDLGSRFGKFGDRLWELARGIDDRPVVASRKRKSWSVENTFSTDVAIDEVARYLAEEAEELWEKLQARSMVGRTITVKLRSADFTTATRRCTPEQIPATAGAFAELVLSLLPRFDFPAGGKFRLAGVGVSNFLQGSSTQPDLFE
jgi:DNA polymerase IV